MHVEYQYYHKIPLDIMYTVFAVMLLAGVVVQTILSVTLVRTRVTDADTAYRRQVAMDEARRRMQEQHDAKAAHYAEQQKLVSAIYRHRQ